MKAVEMAEKQRRIAADFTATFPSETVRRWRKMVKEWQANTSSPNPYVSNERGKFLTITLDPPHLMAAGSASKLSEARLRLTQEEAAEAERGQHTPHKVPASVFIRMGLELEDQQ